MNDEEDMSCKRCDINCDNCGCYDGCNCREHYKYNRNCMDCIGLTKSLKTDTYCDKCKIEEEEFREKCRNWVIWAKSMSHIKPPTKEYMIDLLELFKLGFNIFHDQTNRSCVKLSINK